MARPARSWVPKTYTVSPEVERTIAIKAAEQGLPPGTIIDILVWNAWLKPDEARLKMGGFSEDQLERIFAEEALEFLDGNEAVAELSEEIDLEGKDGDPLADNLKLRVVLAMVKRWRTTRLIEKEHQAVVKSFLDNKNVVPSIYLHDLVDEDWFLPKKI